MQSKIEWVENYRKAGFRPLPLLSNSKEPINVSFDIIEQKEYKEDNNIGLFMGSRNGLIIADLDEPQSEKVVTDKFREMGLLDKLTTVRSPKHKGLHVWLRCLDVPAGVNQYYKYNPSIGKGELRLRYSAYIVAPGSVLPEGEYIFEQGGIEAFLTEPVVEWTDLTWMLREKTLQKLTQPGNTQSNKTGLVEPATLPIRLLYLPEPKAALAIAEVLRTAERYKPVYVGERKYENTSDAEAGLMMDLVLAGWDFDQIKILFDSVAPPHYREADKGYLLRINNYVVYELVNSGKRRQIADAYQYVPSMPWSGLNGGNKMKVTLALMANAWQWNTFQPKMSYRAIDEYATVDKNTAFTLVRELQKDGYIHLLKADNKSDTQQYDLTPIIIGKKLYSSNPPNNVTTVSILSTSPAVAELWRRKFLGSTAELICIHLSPSKPYTKKELADLTGKCVRTIEDVLEQKLSIHDIAKEDENGSWLRGPADLEEVARKLGADISASERRAKHKKEREINNEWKERYK